MHCPRKDWKALRDLLCGMPKILVEMVEIVNDCELEEELVLHLESTMGTVAF